jgi:hypothetical protein
MTLILDELVIELSEDFAVSNIGCPMPHESSPILSNCERHFTNHQLEFPASVVIGFKCPGAASDTKASFMARVIYAPISKISAFLSQLP